MTPQYASPEQFLGEPVTTAVDIYQLGLLAVELLTGLRPFHARSGNVVELAHAVVSEDAPKPSLLLARSGLPAAEVAAILRARRTSARRLRRQLRGDLDAVAGCALARAPRQRYSSALQFADDLDAWLQQLPLRARPPALGYRMQRFVSRNWLATVATATLAIIVIAYVATVFVQAERLRHESELNRLVRDYLVELLREADPRFAGSPQTSAEHVINEGLLRARERFTGQPDLLAELLGIGGEVQVGRGNYVRAAELIGDALTLRRGLDPHDPRLTDVLAEYGRALHYSARYAEAERALKEAETRWYAQGASGSAWIPMSLADVQHSRGEYTQAEAVLRRADAAQRSSQAPLLVHGELASQLGTLLHDMGRADEGRALQQSALDTLRRRFGDDNGTVLAAKSALARSLVVDGEADEGRALAEQTLAAQTRVYGLHHALIGIARHTQALADELDGRFETAVTGLDVVLDRDFATIADGNVLPTYAHVDRAWQHLALDQDNAAQADLDVAEPVLLAIRDGGHPRWASLQLARAVLAQRRGDRVAARRALDNAIRQRTELFGGDHPFTREARRWLSAFDSGIAPAAASDAPVLESRRIALVLASPKSRSVWP